jgi:myo-inositol-1(or 4)-monophosphatase
LANARNFNFVIFAGKLREFDIAAANHINCDLFTYQDSDFLIVSKNEQNLLQIKGIIKNNRL